MKKQIFVAFTLIILSVSFLAAQFPGGGTPPTPAQMIANRVAHLTSLLTLTAAQQTQATTIYTSEQTLVAPLQTSLQTAHTALNTAVQKNDLAGIITDSTQIGSLTTQLTEDQAKAEAAFFLILTPDQQTKLEQSHMNGRGFGGPGAGFRGRPRQ